MKTTTRNVKNFGKHSELLKITDAPLVYVKDEIQKMNEEYRLFLSPGNFAAIKTQRFFPQHNRRLSGKRNPENDGWGKGHP